MATGNTRSDDMSVGLASLQYRSPAAGHDGPCESGTALF